MARKTKEEARETRDKIVSAAIDIFYEKGFANTTLEEIARRADVTRGAIYWHFENKLDVFLEIHARFHTSLMDMLLHELESTTASPLRQLEDLTVRLLCEIQTDEHKQRLLSIFILQLENCPEMAPLADRTREAKAQSLAVFSRFFTNAIKMGDLPSTRDPDLLALAFFCYLSGVATEYLRTPSLFDLNREAPALVKLFLEGLMHCGQ
jgi:AcrR family transcriptional regulator